MSNSWNAAVIGGTSLVTCGVAGYIGYKLGEGTDTRTSKKVSLQWVATAFGLIAATGLAVSGGLRAFSHQPGQNLARTLRIMRPITTQGALLACGAGAFPAFVTALAADAEKIESVLKVGGGAAAVTVGSGFLYGIIKHGAKPTLTLAGRVFAKWALAPIAGGAILVGYLVLKED